MLSEAWCGVGLVHGAHEVRIHDEGQPDRLYICRGNQPPHKHELKIEHDYTNDVRMVFACKTCSLMIKTNKREVLKLVQPLGIMYDQAAVIVEASRDGMVMD